MKYKHLATTGCALAFAFAGGTALAQDAVQVNCADAATLAAGLHNVGESKAAAIIEYREANGPFQAPEDLLAVKGIGEKTLEANESNLDLTAECG